MKPKIYAVLLFLSIILSFSACKEDNLIVDSEPKGINGWIDSIMQINYLWYEDIPAASYLNFQAEPEAFFKSLLSAHDGKTGYHYSYIEDVSASTLRASTRSISNIDRSYGFDYRLFHLGDTTFIAQLLYTAPNSPASEAGLQRGDWIYTMNGAFITENNYLRLYGGAAMEVVLAKYANGGLHLSDTIQLAAARSVLDNPVYYHHVFNWGGKTVGYLVYNHFTAGETDDDEIYNDELLNLSKEFQSAGVNEFILDLRYNNGGVITSAQLISTMLAPAIALNNTFCYIEYNNKQHPRRQSMILAASLLSRGANLNLQTVYVLVSSTTASASELVINTLRPYMNVVIIGDQTEGKNVGSVVYTNETYRRAIHPIVCKLYNAENESDYVNGFTPNYYAPESSEVLDYFLPFGDTNELLLGTALSLIDGSYAAGMQAKTRSSAPGMLRLKEVGNSLGRKASNGVVIDGGE
ncbi:MAG: S41 family peptidase [Paludibacter sp.]|nr:S41 family peptidase [Paludibacter sp.]